MKHTLGGRRRGGRVAVAAAVTLMLGVLVAIGTAVAQASTNETVRVGFIDTQAVLPHVQGGDKLLSLYKQRQQELQPLSQELSSLQNQAVTGSLTPQEKEKVTVLQQTIKATQQRWDKDINKAAAPIEAEVNKALAKVAKERGVEVVFDANIARRLQLVAYAAPGTNLTQAVIDIVSQNQ